MVLPIYFWRRVADLGWFPRSSVGTQYGRSASSEAQSASVGIPTRSVGTI